MNVYLTNKFLEPTTYLAFAYPESSREAATNMLEIMTESLGKIKVHLTTKESEISEKVFRTGLARNVRKL